MKIIINIALVTLLVLGMTMSFAAGDDPIYEDGVLTMTMYEDDNSAQIIRISDGEIIENGASPDVIMIMKLRDSDDGSGMKYIDITTNDVGVEGDPVNFPTMVVIYLSGDPDEANVNPNTVFFDLRGEQIDPDDIPDITIYDLRGEQIDPDIITPIVSPY